MEKWLPTKIENPTADCAAQRYRKTYLPLKPPSYLPTNEHGTPCGQCIPNAAFVSHDPLERTVGLTGWPNLGWGGYPTGCRGDSVTLRSPGNTPLGQTDGLVAQTRWGTPPGHVPSVRSATREPAAVIQTVVHCMLQNRFAGFRTRRVVGKHMG